jgi:hypothetical protein
MCKNSISRRLMATLTATAAILLPSGTASAGSPDRTHGSKQSRAAAPSKVYCYEVERTGSLLITRMCMTQKEWRIQGVEVSA